jgi:hypothetical protein
LTRRQEKSSSRDPRELAQEGSLVPLVCEDTIIYGDFFGTCAKKYDKIGAEMGGLSKVVKSFGRPLFLIVPLFRYGYQ